MQTDTWSLMDHRRTVPSSEPDRKRCGSVAEKSTDQMRLVCSANAATCDRRTSARFSCKAVTLPLTVAMFFQTLLDCLRREPWIIAL